MKCLVCRNGETRWGTATVTLERDELILVVKSVPARICENCGEEYLDEIVANHLAKMGEEAAATDVKVDVRDYIAA